MLPSEGIGAAIRAANASGRPAIVAFMTAGFPDRAGFIATLNRIGEAADVIEIGVPFSDPMADGMTIQRASQVALRDGVTLKWILDELTGAPTRPAAPLLLMSYLNPLLRFGAQALALAANRAGVSGFIVPDLPYEESADLAAALSAHGMALVQMVTPVTPAERLERLCANAQGFVYAVTMTGTTGKQADVPQDVLAYLDRVKRASSAPVCAGFGIRSREQVTRLASHVDGVVVGSALVEALERRDDPAAFLRALRS